MQTLKNIHKEYLNKLAVELTTKACVNKCKCDSDDSTEKKKCLFRKTLNGCDKVLVDLWFELIDAASEVIYTKTVDDMAYPDLIREHFSQTKAKSFYEVLSDEFESVISDVYKKVCMIIPDVCRENPGFEKLVDYAEKELHEYFTFEKAFSYSRYMIENHSYIEDWFPVADMDTEEILVEAEKEPEMIYAYISEKNYEYTENIEELLEYTYHEMYKKSQKDLFSIFFDFDCDDTFDRYAEDYIDDDDFDPDYYIDDDDFDPDYDIDADSDEIEVVKELLYSYQHLRWPECRYYAHVWENIAYITSKGKDNKKKQKAVLKRTKSEGMIPTLEAQKEYYKGIEKLEKSRLEIYKSQMYTINDDIYKTKGKRSKSSSSKGDVNKIIREMYYAAFDLDILKIYEKEPYRKVKTGKATPTLLFPKCVCIEYYMDKCIGCREKCFNCEIGTSTPLIEALATALFIIAPDCTIIKEETIYIDLEMLQYIFDPNDVDSSYYFEEDDCKKDNCKEEDFDEEDSSKDDSEEDVDKESSNVGYVLENDDYQEYLDHEYFTKLYWYKDNFNEEDF